MFKKGNIQLFCRVSLHLADVMPQKSRMSPFSPYGAGCSGDWNSHLKARGAHACQIPVHLVSRRRVEFFRAELCIR